MSEGVYYRHLRRVQKVKTANKINPDNPIIKEHHIPYGTFCAKILSGTGTIIGASLCSEKDDFEKKKGRQISFNRMEAVEKGNFPQQLAVFIPQVLTREECLTLLKRLKIEHNQNKFVIKDPEREYEMHYNATVEA